LKDTAQEAWDRAKLIYRGTNEVLIQSLNNDFINYCITAGTSIDRAVTDLNNIQGRIRAVDSSAVLSDKLKLQTLFKELRRINPSYESVINSIAIQSTPPSFETVIAVLRGVELSLENRENL